MTMTNHENTIGYYRANYQVRDEDTATILNALGQQWAASPVDDIAQRAANLYYRIKGSFVTEYYWRKIV